MRHFSSKKPVDRGQPSDTCVENFSQDPTLWEVYRLIVKVKDELCLDKGTIGTLRALISLTRADLDPYVYASNKTLSERAEGTSERSLRRHLGKLVDCGLITRNDSPNGKRYVSYAPDGTVLKFGFDLRPALLLRSALIEMAAQNAEEKGLCRFLKRKLGSLLYRAGLGQVCPETVARIKPMKRQKLSSEALQSACDELETALDRQQEMNKVSHDIIAIGPEEIGVAANMAANDSQNDRHKITTNTLQLDSDSQDSFEETATNGDDIALLRRVTALSKEAMSYAPTGVYSWVEALELATTLGRHMGIGIDLISNALRRIGGIKVTMTIFAMLQISGRVRNLAAYFNSLTLGSRARGFDPMQVLIRCA